MDIDTPVTQFLEFVRSIDSEFSHYELEGTHIYLFVKSRSQLADLLLAAWPSTIDDFVDDAKKRLASGSD